MADESARATFARADMVAGKALIVTKQGGMKYGDAMYHQGDLITLGQGRFDDKIISAGYVDSVDYYQQQHGLVVARSEAQRAARERADAAMHAAAELAREQAEAQHNARLARVAELEQRQAEAEAKAEGADAKARRAEQALKPDASHEQRQAAFALKAAAERAREAADAVGRELATARAALAPAEPRGVIFA